MDQTLSSFTLNQFNPFQQWKHTWKMSEIQMKHLLDQVLEKAKQCKKLAAQRKKMEYFFEKECLSEEE